jgi:hypothetical protein
VEAGGARESDTDPVPVPVPLVVNVEDGNVNVDNEVEDEETGVAGAGEDVGGVVEERGKVDTDDGGGEDRGPGVDE